MNRRVASLICGVSLTGLAAFAAATAADAQSAFHPARVLAAPRVAARPFQPAGRAHVFFGSIVHLTTHAFALRLRSGRVINVDDSIALATDRFSAPLFIGKIVVVRGQFDEAGVLHGENIEKLPQLDPGTNQDR